MALTPRSSAAVQDEKRRLSSARQVNSTKLGQRGANGIDDENDVSRGLHKKGNATGSSLFFLMLLSSAAALLIVAMPWTAPAPQQHHIRQRQLQPFNKDPKVTASVVSANPNFETAREGVDYSNEWGFRTMKKKLKCKEVFRQNGGQRPIYAQETWNYLRRLYRAVVEESTEQEESSITPEDAVTPTSGFLVPFQVRQVPGKGRGVFVLRDVKQGEPLWSTKHTARFQSGRDFRKFIFSLARDNGLACEVLDMWTYIEDVGTEDQEKDVLRISIDMDEGVLVNSSGQDPIPAPNMGCDKEGAKLIEGGCDVYDFALHDIKAGDELLFRYWDFEARNSWEKFGIAKKE